MEKVEDIIEEKLEKKLSERNLLDIPHKHQHERN